jgi:hypothetical protein
MKAYLVAAKYDAVSYLFDDLILQQYVCQINGLEIHWAPQSPIA